VIQTIASSVPRGVGLIAILSVLGGRVAQAGPSPITYDFSWGSRGHGPGQIGEADWIACGGDGSVYISDTGNLRVEHFTRTGQLIDEWPLNSQPPGPAYGIAVGPDGDVYVARPEAEDVEVYSPQGSLLRAIVPGGGAVCHDVLLKPDGTCFVLTDHGIFVFDGQGQPLWSTPGAFGGTMYYLSVDDAGQIYTSGAREVVQLTATGSLENVFFPTAPGDSVPVFTGGVSAAGGTLLVVDTENPRLLALSNSGDVIWTVSYPVGALPYGGGGVAPDGDSGYFVLDGGAGRVVHLAPQAVPARVATWGQVKSTYRK